METMQRGTLDDEQISALLLALKPHRVRTLDGNSYLPHFDVRAMLTRILGFGAWDDIENHPVHLIDERPRQLSTGKDGLTVAYKASRRLHVFNRSGQFVCMHDGTSIGTATMGVNSWADAHETAAKAAESEALKRAAINLGDQFGLGLYNDGSLDPLVRKLVHMPPDTEPTEEP